MAKVLLVQIVLSAAAASSAASAPAVSCRSSSGCNGEDPEEMSQLQAWKATTGAKMLATNGFPPSRPHFAPPSLGRRGFSNGKRGGTAHFIDPRCQGNGVFNCAGTSVPYPSEPGIMYYSEYNVPDIPTTFDPAEYPTYYEYFNLWFSDTPPGGYFNQFVPQLYLGSVLCNSSNAVVEDGTSYNPRGILLNSWHLGSMYYFALCDKGIDGDYNCTSTTFQSRAATGKLVPVEPGERVWTRFVLGPDWVWTLGMGVVGGGPDRESYVTVERPFMGLLDSTSSWAEERYSSVGVGGCQENYNQKPGSLPAPWKVDFTVTSMRSRNFWQPWVEFVEAKCPWAPKGKVTSCASRDNRTQTAHWVVSFSHGGDL